MASARLEKTSHTSSGTPVIRQCRRCPDGPSSRSISNPSSTARHAEWSRPTTVCIGIWWTIEVPETVVVLGFRVPVGQRGTLPDTRSWSWGESNPRPSSGHRSRYDHSRIPVRGHRTAGSASPVAGAFRRVFPRCQPSFRLSAVSPCGPPLLLLTGCSGQAPCAIAGHDFSLFATWIRRRGRTAHQCWQLWFCPCFESPRQLWSHESASGLGVETDQPRVVCVFSCLLPPTSSDGKPYECTGGI